MSIETVNNWAGAFLIVASILGIMALIFIGLCIINQKRDGEVVMDLGSDTPDHDPDDFDNYNFD